MSCFNTVVLASQEVNTSWFGKATAALSKVAGSYVEPSLVIGEYSTKLGETASKVQGNVENAEMFRNASYGFGVARGLHSSVRSFFAWTRIVTLSAFLETDESTGTWAKDKEGNYIFRSPANIANAIAECGARTLSFACAFHQLKIVNLGTHAKRMCYGIIGLWSFILTLDLIESTAALVDQTTLSNLPKKLAAWVTSLFTELYFLIDAGTLWIKHPAFQIGACIFVISVQVLGIVVDTVNLSGLIPEVG